jgi:hypothetical protein
MAGTGTVEHRPVKPLGRRAYGSIGHLPNSRMGPADHHVPDGQARICTMSPRPGDTVVVQEKIDGSCMSVANVDGEIVALIRAGYRASDGTREFQRLFDQWVGMHRHLFAQLLSPGERVVGEWVALAHGTIYEQLPGPFVAFDIMVGAERAPALEVRDRCGELDLPTVPLLAAGPGAVTVDEAVARLGGNGAFGAVDGPEGVVYRVERNGRTDFCAKWVNPDKVDGIYLPEISGDGPRWLWPPR